MDQTLLNSLFLSLTLSGTAFSTLILISSCHLQPFQLQAEVTDIQVCSAPSVNIPGLELVGDSSLCASGRNQQPGNHRSEERKTATKPSNLQERGSTYSLKLYWCSLYLPSILSSDHFCPNCHLSFSTSVVKRIMWSWWCRSVSTQMRHPLQQRIMDVRVKMTTVIKRILMLSVPA